jgi:hypothetical protein
MDLRDMIEITNVLIATIAIPPAISLLLVVTREEKVVSPEQRRINKALTILFSGISLAALINAALALSSILGGGLYAHNLSPYRSLGINIFFSLVSWFIYFSHIGIRKFKKGQ